MYLDLLKTKKIVLFHELKLRYKEYFESQFAFKLINNPDLFGSVRKLSSNIVEHLNYHSTQLVDIIEQNPKIKEHLSQPFFGAILNNGEDLSAKELITKMLMVLQHDNTNLALIMQVHCVFIHHIYDQLVSHPQKKSWVNQLFPDHFFSADNRSRVKKTTPSPLTSQIGITKHPVFMKKIGQITTRHQRALDQFDIAKESSFHKLTKEKLLPTVCGPSGHTGSLLLGAMLYGRFSAEELKEYSLACFAFLAAGGNHSFHEVFIIANLLNVPYDPHNYEFSISSSINSTPVMKELKTHFPEFLDTKPIRHEFRSLLN